MTVLSVSSDDDRRDLLARMVESRMVEAPGQVRLHGLEVDPGARSATLHGTTLALTAKEFELLAYLAGHPGLVFSRDELLRAVWRSSAAWQQEATVTEHVRRLRIKIELDPSRPVLLETVRGAGYRFRAVACGSKSDEADIRRGIDRGEFVVHYQPVVSLDDAVSSEERRIVRFEALVRWNHPHRGVLDADAFVDEAARTGQIIEIGAMVLESACRQIATWNSFGLDVGLSVNISGRELADPHLVGRVVASLDSTGIDPTRLWLEVNESVLTEELELELVGNRLRVLAGLGVGVAIDDFGTGWAGLLYLRELPVRALKIDQVFVRGLGRSAHDLAIVRSVLSLGAELGMTVVAEGVETAEQERILRELGCLLAQGFLYAEATSAGDARIDRVARIVSARTLVTH
jgi:EAL domain-containing protein (putative c-di-GMP-specific phosphodiesterase class I)